MKIVQLKNVLWQMIQRIGLSGEHEQLTEKSDETLLLCHIQKAHQEWIEANQYFDMINDPDLIDYAALSIKAAEKKYVYLLKVAREMNLMQEIQTMPLDIDFGQPLEGDIHFKSS